MYIFFLVFIFNCYKNIANVRVEVSIVYDLFSTQKYILFLVIVLFTGVLVLTAVTSFPTNSRIWDVDFRIILLFVFIVCRLDFLPRHVLLASIWMDDRAFDVKGSFGRGKVFSSGLAPEVRGSGVFFLFAFIVGWISLLVMFFSSRFR